MSKFSSFITGTMIGGLVGSALVLLFTPFTGNQLQTNVCGYIQNIKDEVRLAGEQKKAELEAELETLRSGEG